MKIKLGLKNIKTTIFIFLDKIIIFELRAHSTKEQYTNATINS